MQRVRLPPAAVEREHQLSAQALAERVRGDERLELGDELVVAAERQVAVDALLERAQAQLLEAGDLALRERLVVQVRQRLAAPERERLEQTARPLYRIVQLPRLRDQRLELLQVDFVRRNVQQIPGRSRPDPICADQLPQGGDVPVQRGLRAFRRLFAPQRLDQLWSRDDLLAVEEQRREQRPLLGTRRGQITIALDDPQRTKQLELHAFGLSHALARR